MVHHTLLIFRQQFFLLMKTILLLIATTAGVLFPYGSNYTFLIRYFLMLMLFFSFLDARIGKEIIRRSHFAILACIIIGSILVYFLLKPVSIVLAQTAFITAIAPTAIAAPVIISLKKGKVEFVSFSLLLNNVVIALLIPFLLPILMNSDSEISIGKVLLPVIVTLSAPFAAAQITKKYFHKIWRVLVNWKDSSFYILVINIYIATSEASHYIRSELTSEIKIVFFIAITSAALCILFFSLGWLIGGKEFASEASQALGQKNNAFTIWISLSFVSPIAVLGPVFYVLFQNLYISWELFKHHASSKAIE
jgi:BASS family bile acid:Na+ symporter